MVWLMTVSYTHLDVYKRQEQYRIADDPARSCEIARTMIFGKLSNGAASIQRTLRCV